MAGARIQVKRATAAAWTSANTVLFAGEIGLETDTGKFKIGNGSTAWTSLAYSIASNLSASTLNDLGDVTITSAADGDFLRWNGTAWINDAVNLSTDTVGSYVTSLVAGTGVTLSNNSGEGATPTVAIGQSVGTSDSVTFVNVTAALTGNASTATTLQTARNIAGQSFNGSANISIAPTDLTGVTSSAAEINILDGATLSTTELNYVDGVTSAIQTQMDLKAPLASPTFTGTVTVPTPVGDTNAATKAYVDSTASTTASNASTALANHEADTTNIHGIADTSILVTTTGTQTLTNKTITSPSGLVKGDVGLGNVDNTADTAKPVSTAQQTALDLKANLVSPTFTTPNIGVATGTSLVLSGDLTVSGTTTTINSTAVNVKNQVVFEGATDNDFETTLTVVDPTADRTITFPDATTTVVGTDTTQTLTNKTLTSPAISTPSGLVKGDVGLSNVDNTSNATERAATATLTNKTLTSPVINTPTGIVKGDVGLGSVDNTADTAKPVSTAQQTALDLKANLASPTFTGTVTVPTPVNATDAVTKTYVDSGIAGATITSLNDVGDVTITSASAGDFLKWNGTAFVNDPIDLGTDTVGNYVSGVTAGTGITVTHTPSEGSSPTIAVTANTFEAHGAVSSHEADTTSVHGIADTSILVTTTGTQTLTNKTITAPSGLVKGDVGLGNVDNTADTAKPVSTAGQTALDLKANLASPTFTGTPTLPTGTIATTQTAANNTTAIATTAYVDTAVANLVDSAPATLNTLDELALALGDDPSFATTVATNIGLKAPLASPTFTGTVTIPTGASITAPTGLVKGDVGLGSVDNTADTAKPVSTAQQTALDLKANLASPTFTGTVTVPTPTNGTDAANKTYADGVVTAAKIITAAGGDGTNGQALTTNGAGTLDFTTITGTTEASIISAVGGDGSSGQVLKTNGSGDLSFGDVALGTNTTGNYMSNVSAGDGITVTHTAGEGSTATISARDVLVRFYMEVM